MRTAAALLVLILASPAPAQEAESPVADRIDAAMAACRADGPHYHRSAPLADLGAAAAGPLAGIGVDSSRLLEERILAVQALGRLKVGTAVEPLRSLARGEETPPPLRKAAEESLFLLGETSAVDAEVERLLTRYTGIAVARAGARARLAEIYAATGRFESAARILRSVMESTEDSERKWYLAYNLACYECLAGNRDAALAATAMAVRFSGVDLDWMVRDGDLRLLHEDPEFKALVDAARIPRDAAAPAPASAEKSPEVVAWEKFSRSYWDGAFDAYIEACNSYWDGYRDWLESEGREPGEAAGAAWAEEKGPSPVDPNPEWIRRFREQLAKHRETPLAARIRGELLTILGNERMAKDWVNLYLEAVAETPEAKKVGDGAQSARYFAEQVGRKDEVLAALVSVLEEYPKAASSAGIRIALAEERRFADDLDGARKLYSEVIEIYPDTFESKEAQGALYEMEKLANGMPAPLFETKDIHGRPLSLESLRGKVVVLDFWATWCGPCLGELPHVKKLHAEMAGRDDFVMIGISLDADGIALVDLLEEEGMRWPQVCGLRQFEEPLARLYNVRGIPDAFLIDREGKIAGRGMRGEALLESVRKALDQEK